MLGKSARPKSSVSQRRLRQDLSVRLRRKKRKERREMMQSGRRSRLLQRKKLPKKESSTMLDIEWLFRKRPSRGHLKRLRAGFSRLRRRLSS